MVATIQVFYNPDWKTAWQEQWLYYSEAVIINKHLSQLEKEVGEILTLLDRIQIFEFIYLKQKNSLKELLVKLSGIQK